MSLAKKLYSNQVFHCGQDFLAKYPGKATVAANGNTSAAWEGINKPQNFAHPEAFAAMLEYKNSDLINRAPIGMSELGGVLLNLQLLVHDGLERKVLHPDFAARWEALFTRFNL